MHVPSDISPPSSPWLFEPLLCSMPTSETKVEGRMSLTKKTYSCLHSFLIPPRDFSLPRYFLLLKIRELFAFGLIKAIDDRILPLRHMNLLYLQMWR